MPSINDPSSSKSGPPAIKKWLDSSQDTAFDHPYQTLDQDLETHERLQYLKQDIRALSNDSLSRSIKLGKLKGAKTRDGNLISQLEQEIQSIGEMVASGKEAVEELEKEIRKERKKRKYEVAVDFYDIVVVAEEETLRSFKLLRSLTDTLPTVGGAEMDENGPAGGLSSGGNAAEELGDFA
ncbi:hypothetical protein HO133_008435 [Letharia lupina]|uniref:Uncharacterized protein n=1 Tax=Letharia lupina TaxID=560253 RepID=A0A8H6CNW6_9LECA|nr:uncharacterized protein HO133_008435 [Letharia lupina]KAF6226994.1 hypothetical protein HO133_008435 [Letharia lupina]